MEINWEVIGWEIINEYSTEELIDIRYQILKSFDEKNKLLDIDILFKHKERVKREEINFLIWQD